MPSIQRLTMYITPVWALNILCKIQPKTVIGLLCHWINEKNPNLEERGLAKRFVNPVPVAKKFSKLSILSMLYLLKQDKTLWKFYITGVGIIPFPTLPYLLLQLIFDLGGAEGKQKVKELVIRCRVTLGGRAQGEMLENFKTDTVLDLFEELPPFEVKLRLELNPLEVVAIWLTHWDLRMQQIGHPSASAYWIAQLPAQRAFEVERTMKEIEFRKKWVDEGQIQFERGKRVF